jgi:phage terminase large subunit
VNQILRIRNLFKPSPVFEWNYNCKKDIVINQGGTSSGKTFSILQVLLFRALREPKTIITIVGQDIPNLKKGSIRDLENVFEQVRGSHEIFKDFRSDYNKQDKVHTLKNGSLIEFSSFKDSQDAKNGKRDYLFINEANGIPYDIFDELQVRTRKQVFIDYNPTAPFWAHSKLIGRDDVQLFISNFTHNDFVDPKTKEKILRYKTTDPDKWKVYGLGKTGKIKGVIFPNVTWVSRFPAACRKVSLGLDFGFTNDVTALIKQGELHGERWAELFIYETGLLNEDISNKMKFLNISRSLQIFADSAEPKSIATIKKHHWHIKKTTKGKDSVKWGIDKIKEMPLNIVVSPAWKKEQLNYKWMEKDGEFLNTPIDKWNHAWDALRYAIAGRESAGGLLAFG